LEATVAMEVSDVVIVGIIDGIGDVTAVIGVEFATTGVRGTEDATVTTEDDTIDAATVLDVIPDITAPTVE